MIRSSAIESTSVPMTQSADWVIIRPDDSMCRLGNWPYEQDFAKEVKLRTRLLLKNCLRKHF